MEDSGLNRESDDPGAEGLEAGPLLLLVPPQVEMTVGTLTKADTSDDRLELHAHTTYC